MVAVIAINGMSCGNVKRPRTLFGAHGDCRRMPPVRIDVWDYAMRVSPGAGRSESATFPSGRPPCRISERSWRCGTFRRRRRRISEGNRIAAARKSRASQFGKSAVVTGYACAIARARVSCDSCKGSDPPGCARSDGSACRACRSSREDLRPDTCDSLPELFPGAST